MLASYLLFVETNVLQEVLPLSWNKKNPRGSSTDMKPKFCKGFPYWDLFVSLVKKILRWDQSIKQFLNLFLRVAIGSGCPSDFSNFKSVLAKNNLISHNCGIIHDFNVGLFWRHPGQCAWMEWDSHDVTQIENTCGKCESNWIKKTLVESHQKKWVESS